MHVTLDLDVQNDSQIAEIVAFIRSINNVKIEKILNNDTSKKITGSGVEPTLDFEKFDEETKTGIKESIAAYRAGNMAYFISHEQLMKELEECGD